MLEAFFIGLLSLMLGLSMVFGLVVVARVVEPRGVRVLLRRIAGRG